MKKYDFLSAKRESGELQQWYQYGLAPQIEDWMTFYECKQAQPQMTCLDIAIAFNRGHSTIQRALSFMDEPHFVNPRERVDNVTKKQ